MEISAEIRAYTEADHEAFKGMFREYFSSDLDIKLNAGAMDEICADVAAKVSGGIVFLDLLYLGGEPAGFAEYQVDSSKSDWCEKEGFGSIREFYIARQWRKKGFGERLAIHAENRLRKLGATDVYLTTDEAEGFWLKIGYCGTGEICEKNSGCILVKKI